jgi:hypothetical protein
MSRKDDQQELDPRIRDDTRDALRALNPRQAAFALAYGMTDATTCNNATQSATKAGYSKRTAYQQGCALLKHQKVKHALTLLYRDTREALADIELVNAAWMHRHLSMLARSSVLDYGKVDDHGQFVPDLSQIRDRPELARAIESIKTKRHVDGSHETEIRMMPRRALLDMLGRHADVDAFVRGSIEQDGRDGPSEDDINSARKRAMSGGLRAVKGGRS